ncbi:hypothetical protein [Donghicola sp. XS_ASV15]|uniref:hypothetical protein n=1 Tax=Donghicola sp. XS_ASV15 TaxID=3241295 RepID=UPI00351674D3
MQAERDLHDGLLASYVASPEPAPAPKAEGPASNFDMFETPAAAPAPAAAKAEGPDLTDILF